MSTRWPNDKGESQMGSSKRITVLAIKVLAWMYIATFLIFAVAFLISKAGAQEKPADKPKPPSLSDSDKTKLREFQLKDSQITVEIQKRQLELYQLRDMQQSNTAALNDFKGGLCKATAEDKNSYDVDTQNAQCVQVGQPKK